jgi:glutathione S-transferase
MLGRAFDVASSHLASGLRFGAGLFVGNLGPRPEEPVHLYDFEACPFCRRAREALTALDLEAIIYPCPKGGRFRDEVRSRGGREMFPFLVDPNTDVEMYESADIVAYLYEHYGAGSPPALGQSPLSVLTGSLASATRPMRGRRAIASEQPEQLLELYSFEASPYCRLVREALCELEIPYHLHNVAKGSPSRDAFRARSGRMMMPYLVDPNTGVEMFESADIVAYLSETYGR